MEIALIRTAAPLALEEGEPQGWVWDWPFLGVLWEILGVGMVKLNIWSHLWVAEFEWGSEAAPNSASLRFLVEMSHLSFSLFHPLTAHTCQGPIPEMLLLLLPVLSLGRENIKGFFKADWIISCSACRIWKLSLSTFRESVFSIIPAPSFPRFLWGIPRGAAVQVSLTWTLNKLIIN